MATSADDPRSTSEAGAGEIEELAALHEEITHLRARLADAPKRVHSLEERLLETKGQLAAAVGQNEKLSYTLREAREHIATFRDEVDKLSQPPSAYGIVVGKNDDDTVDILTSGRKMRVALHPDIDHELLDRGAEVVLNESYNVVMARTPEITGEVVTVKEVMDDGIRIVVVGRADEERVCELADAIRGTHIRTGDHLRLDTRSNLLLEKLPRPEVEHLLLEEVPDIAYTDIGGLDDQIEQIADAVELPFLHQDLFAEHQLPAPKGILLYGPPGVRQDADRQGGREQPGQEGRRHDRRGQGPQLLHQHQGPRAAQQVRRRDRTSDPAGVPAGAREERRGLAGDRVLRRDGLDVPHPRVGHQLRHGVDHRAAAAVGDRRRRGAQERDRDRSDQPRGSDRSGDPATRSPRREDQDRTPERARRPRRSSLATSPTRSRSPRANRSPR